VETTAAPMADSDVLATIHDALAADDLLPAMHLTDTGYVDAKRLLSSRTRYDIDLLGPTRSDYHRRRRENKGFAAQDFIIDWERRQAICPAGQTSANWVPTQESRGKPVIRVNFASSTCRICPHRVDCIDAGGVRRTLTLQMQELQIALPATRPREKSAEFRKQYGKRAGIEGTISQAVRGFDLRRSRYIGSAETYLQHLLIAAAIDLSRIYCWLVGEPRA
jgi:transposase